MDPRLLSRVALNGRITASLNSFIPSGKVRARQARDAWTVRGLARGSVVNPTALFRDTSAALTPAPHRLRSRVGLSITSDAMRAARCAG